MIQTSKDDNPTNSRPIVSYGIMVFVTYFLAQMGLSEDELGFYLFLWFNTFCYHGNRSTTNDLNRISP